MRAETNSTRAPVIGLTSRYREEDNSFSVPAEYSHSVVAAGGLPLHIPLIPSAAKELGAVVDAVIICGSASDVAPALYGEAQSVDVKRIHPCLDETALALLEHAFEWRKPVLGIC